MTVAIVARFGATYGATLSEVVLVPPTKFALNVTELGEVKA